MIQKTRHTPLKGRVAQVLNERELAINIGSSDGVTIGTRFAVLSEKAVEIRDPDTGDILGTHDMPKVHVRATVVEDHFSICKTYKYRTVGGGFGIAQVEEMFGPGRRAYETLDAPKESFPAPLSQDDSYVEIGDRVEQVTDDDD